MRADRRRGSPTWRRRAAASGERARRRFAPGSTEPAVTADGAPIRVLLNVADLERARRRSTPRYATASASCAPSSCSAERARCPMRERSSTSIAASSNGRRAAGHDPHARRRRRQADPRRHDRRRDRTRSSACAASACRLRRPEVCSDAAACAGRARGARDGQDHAADGDVPDELRSGARLLDAALAELAARGCAARRPPLGIMVEVPAAALAIERFDAGVLLDRQQRSDAIRHRLRSRRATGRSGRPAQPGGAAAHRPDDRPRRARRARRSACAATWPPIRAVCGRCSTVALRIFPWRRPLSGGSRRRLRAIREVRAVCSGWKTSFSGANHDDQVLLARVDRPLGDRYELVECLGDSAGPATLGRSHCGGEGRRVGFGLPPRVRRCGGHLTHT